MASTKLRLSLGASCFFIVFSSLSCKKLGNKSSSSASTEIPAASEDKPLFSGVSRDSLSEESTGAAKHSLQCAWQQAPSTGVSVAKLSCTVIDAQRQPLKGMSGIKWQIDSVSSDVKINRSEHEAQIYLSFSGPSRDAVFAAIFDMQLTFTASNPLNVEVSGSGRDLIKAPPSQQKLVASCSDFFDMMLIDEYGMATFSQIRRFEGCEKLGSALMNRIFPDAQVRGKVSQAKLLRATCTESNLRLDHQGLGQQAVHATLSPEICGDLALQINAQGL